MTHSFPARRASDLEVYEAFLPLDEEFAALIDDADSDSLAELDRRAANLFDDLSAFVPRLSRYQDLFSDALAKVQAGESKRSEEHTSELQSLMRISYAVFCLKKKKK